MGQRIKNREAGIEKIILRMNPEHKIQKFSNVSKKEGLSILIYSHMRIKSTTPQQSCEELND